MTEEHYNEPDIQPEENSEDGVEIYSKMAIRGFAIFFGTIFAGVLLMINLRNVGYKSAAWKILAFSFFYSLATGIAALMLIKVFNLAGLLFNVVGGVILADYFFPRYFPEDDYYPKPVWNAIAVSIIITLGLLMFVHYTGGLSAMKAAGLK